MRCWLSTEVQRAPSAKAARRVIEAVQRHFSGGEGTDEQPAELPSAAEVRKAISHVAGQRNGYLAWTLYAHLRQAGLPLEARDLAALAGAMLHVDRELYAQHCVKRALSVLDYARSIGQAEDVELLGQACAACAVGGLAELAQELCDEAEALAGGAPNWRMQCDLIVACGRAGQRPPVESCRLGLATLRGPRRAWRLPGPGPLHLVSARAEEAAAPGSPHHVQP